MNNFTSITKFTIIPELVETLKNCQLWQPTMCPGVCGIPVNAPSETNNDAQYIRQTKLRKGPGYRLVHNLIKALKLHTKKRTLGRSTISLTEPGGQIIPHVDCHTDVELFTRYHITICNNGAVFHCGDEQFVAQSGDVFSFNNRLVHSVVNNTDDIRISLQVDLK